MDNEETLTRITDALESISNSLSEISASLDSLDKILSSCTCAFKDNHFLCITGNVSTN